MSTDHADLADRIERSWTEPDRLDAAAVEEAVGMLDRGELRVAEPDGDGWRVNEWAKKAVLLYFRVRDLETTEVGPFEYHDRLPLKSGYEQAGVRVVPPATARYGIWPSPRSIPSGTPSWVGPSRTRISSTT
jgi:2,3,4,5-tetrahydropyridine-2-carboxylate N-succinyltransferase